MVLAVDGDPYCVQSDLARSSNPYELGPVLEGQLMRISVVLLFVVSFRTRNPAIKLI